MPRNGGMYPDEIPFDPYALLPESWQAPARSIGQSLGSLTRRINPGGEYGSVSTGTGISLADMVPQSKLDVGLTLAGMVPAGKIIRRVRPALETHMTKMPWEMTEAEWNKVTNFEPPVPENHVRFYRGEKVTSDPQVRGMKGNWFSSSREPAETFAWEAHFGNERGHQGRSRLTYVDVPKDVYEENWHSWTDPTAHPWHERYKTREGKVYDNRVYGNEDAVVLPPEWARQRKELFRTYDWDKVQKRKSK